MKLCNKEEKEVDQYMLKFLNICVDGCGGDKTILDTLFEEAKS
jgi:ankyrin repeat protein